MSRRDAWRFKKKLKKCVEAQGETQGGTIFSADLGGSSNISKKKNAWRPKGEKGSLSTANGQGLVGPKIRGKLVLNHKREGEESLRSSERKLQEKPRWKIGRIKTYHLLQVERETG